MCFHSGTRCPVLCSAGARHGCLIIHQAYEYLIKHQGLGRLISLTGTMELEQKGRTSLIVKLKCLKAFVCEVKSF